MIKCVTFHHVTSYIILYKFLPEISKNRFFSLFILDTWDLKAKNKNNLISEFLNKHIFSSEQWCGLVL